MATAQAYVAGEIGEPFGALKIYQRSFWVDKKFIYYGNIQKSDVWGEGHGICFTVFPVSGFQAGNGIFLPDCWLPDAVTRPSLPL